MCDWRANVGARKHRTTMKKKFVKVPVRGMTAKDLMALWREGKLFVQQEADEMAEEELMERCRQEALAYVAAIDEFATEQIRPYIKRYWEGIVTDEAFSSGLLMGRKRTMNRYFITAIVFNLQTLGVYKSVCEISQLKLHLKLEGVTQKNSVFKNWGKYAISSVQRKVLREMLKDYNESK